MTAAPAPTRRGGIGPAPAQPGRIDSAGDPTRALRRPVPYPKPDWPVPMLVLVTVSLTPAPGAACAVAGRTLRRAEPKLPPFERGA